MKKEKDYSEYLYPEHAKAIDDFKQVIIDAFKPIFYKVVYFIGLFSKQVRLESYEAGKSMWGLRQYIKDNPTPKFVNNNHNDMVDAFLYSIIGNKYDDRVDHTTISDTKNQEIDTEKMLHAISLLNNEEIKQCKSIIKIEMNRDEYESFPKYNEQLPYGQHRLLMIYSIPIFIDDDIPGNTAKLTIDDGTCKYMPIYKKTI